MKQAHMNFFLCFLFIAFLPASTQESSRGLSPPGEVRQLGGTERAIADTLAAWCALELRGELRPIDRIALFGEAAPDGLFEVWPELQAFLERHEDQRSGGGA